jgi:carbon monoxide dehydrogenase subunit G
MKILVETRINKSVQEVWQTIINIENSVNIISGIVELEVLEKPESGMIGFKWKETRIMFGKSATETMWITDLKENDFYNVRAESHGMIYKSVLKVAEESDHTVLSMEFGGETQTFIAKVMSVIMMPFFKGATIKLLQKDLDDIKVSMES